MPAVCDAGVTGHLTHLPRPTSRGPIGEGDKIKIPLVVPPGTKEAEFLLSWNDDWGHYPTSDIDMTLVNPQGKTFTNKDGSEPGVSLRSPERATLKNPHPGKWQIEINGFSIPAGSDQYQLRVTLDGKIQ